MSNQERLESIIKKEVVCGKEIHEDWNWLIEQAEKVQELQEENKRLRETLAEIASEDEWETVDEARNIARKALEG